MTDPQVDIKETDIFELSPELLNMLLQDHTLTTETKPVNIFWATDNYADRGSGYQYNDKISVEAITGVNEDVIVPRALKSREQQQRRSRDMAEVFTPSWICNKQNNLIDNAWFGRENVFNTEVDNPDKTHTWIVNTEHVIFPEGKTWQEYVKGACLEITCGEAPYLASRYDMVTGEPIPIERRIGILDRKLRIVGEHTNSCDDWIEWAEVAFKGVYGYEWQGDNIVLARESLLYTFIEYYRFRFGENPPFDIIKKIAYIISWNIWQMDGLKCVIPNSCGTKRISNNDLFGVEKEIIEPCKGCKTRNIRHHNGIYAKIMDWEEGKPIEFVSLIHNYAK